MISEKEFNSLLRDTEKAFNKAPIKKYAEERGHKWNFSISATKLGTNATVIIGFNWGAENNEEYDPQEKMPNKSFRDLMATPEMASMQRIVRPLERYLSKDEIDRCVQTNFCFFRSKNEGQISKVDLDLSTPLFKKLMEIIQPKRIIGFSAKLRNYFKNSEEKAKVQLKRIPSNGTNIIVGKGKLQLPGKEIPLLFLPHPNAPYTSEAREKAWEHCFDKKFAH